MDVEILVVLTLGLKVWGRLVGSLKAKLESLWTLIVYG